MTQSSLERERSLVGNMKSGVALLMIIGAMLQTLIVTVSCVPTNIGDEMLELPFKLPSGFNFADAPSPLGCGYVFRNADMFSREIAAQRIDRNHKIIKYIENCYKTADGWRFKKSTTNQRFRPYEKAYETKKASQDVFTQDDPGFRDAFKQLYNDLRAEAAFSAMLDRFSAAAAGTGPEQEIGNKLAASSI